MEEQGKSLAPNPGFGRKMLALMVVSLVGSAIFTAGAILKGGTGGAGIYLAAYFLYLPVSFGLAGVYIWYFLHYRLGFRSFAQFFWGGLVLGIVMLFAGQADSVTTSVAAGIAITISAPLFWLIVFGRSGVNRNLFE